MDPIQVVPRRSVLKGIAGLTGMAAVAACTPGISVSSPRGTTPPTAGATPGPSGTATGGKPHDGVELTMIAQAGTAYQPALESWAETFLAMTGAKVVFDFTPWEALLPKAQASLSAPGSVDMFLSDIEFEYSFHTSLLDLSDRITASGYDLDGLFASARNYGAGVDGNPNTRYGLPLTAGTPVTLYRVPQGQPVPSTWDEFNDFLAANTKDGRFGLAFSGIAAATLKNFLPRFRGFGGQLLSPDWGPLINSEAGVEALTQLKSQMQYTPEGMLAWDDAQAAAAFLNGDIAVLETWPTFIMPKIQDPSASKVVDQWTVAPLPGNPAGHFTQHNGMVFKDSKAPDAAFDFLAYITSPGEAARMMLEFKEDSARKTAWEDPDVVADRPYLKDLAASLEVAKPFTRGYAGWLELFLALGDAIQAGIAGTSEPKAALDDAAGRWKEIIDRAKPSFPYSE